MECKLNHLSGKQLLLCTIERFNAGLGQSRGRVLKRDRRKPLSWAMAFVIPPPDRQFSVFTQFVILQYLLQTEVCTLLKTV